MASFSLDEISRCSPPLLPSLPEADPLHFAPRVRVPVLMLNGRHDYLYPVQTSQLPLLRILGTREQDKKHVLFEAAHEVVAVRTQVIGRCWTGWTDTLGPCGGRSRRLAPSAIRDTRNYFRYEITTR